MLSRNRSLTPADIKKILVETADDMDTPGYDDRTGGGRVNAYNAVQAVPELPQAPVANFTVSLTRGQAPLAVGFTDDSTGAISERTWNFGDGTHSNDVNPSHIYSRSGVYTATLTVTGPGGSATKRMTSPIVVEEPIAKPNVRPYAAPSWSGSVVVSNRKTATRDALAVSSKKKAYFSAAVINDGTAAVSRGFRMDVFIDGKLRNSSIIRTPFKAGSWKAIRGISVGILQPGTRVVSVALDTLSSVSERKENDNVITKIVIVE